MDKAHEQKLEALAKHFAGLHRTKAMQDAEREYQDMESTNKQERSTWLSGIAKNQPRWVVRFGKSTANYYTIYQAEQFVRALRLNGTACTLEEIA